MGKKVIIGKHNNTYFHCVSIIKNKEGYIIDTNHNSTEEQIRELLEIKIDKFKYVNNLLIVKTNDDLVVIENYLQINHDKVFKSFNKNMAKMIINKRQISLQSKSPYKWAIAGCATLSIAAIIGITNAPPYTYSEPDYSASGIVGGSAITVDKNDSPKELEFIEIEDITTTEGIEITNNINTNKDNMTLIKKGHQ